MSIEIGLLLLNLVLTSISFYIINFKLEHVMAEQKDAAIERIEFGKLIRSNE